MKSVYIRQGCSYLDFITYPQDGQQVLTGLCQESPFWWLTQPTRIFAREKAGFQGRLEVETERKHWYTEDWLISRDRWLSWRIAIPPGYDRHIVIYTPAKVPLGGPVEEPRFEILYWPAVEK